MQRCLTLGLLLATLLSLGKLLVLSDSHFADVARRKDETKQKEALPAANPEPRNAVHTLEAAAAAGLACTPLLMHAYAILDSPIMILHPITFTRDRLLHGLLAIACTPSRAAVHF